jgi:hypothetical protein
MYNVDTAGPLNINGDSKLCCEKAKGHIKETKKQNII